MGRPVSVDKSPRHIREMFDQISPRYDFLNHLLSLNTDVAWRRRAAEAAAPAGSRPARLLDVCTGTGDLALELARRWRCDVVGSDFAGRMLEIGTAKAARHRSRAVRFGQADTTRLPFRDASFDAATVAFGIRNVGDTAAGIREMARVVRPGGRVVILEFTVPPGRLIRRGYLLYFQRVLPMLGELIAPTRRGAYRYLPASVSEWPSPEALAGTMRAAGLIQVEFELLTLGVAAIHRGTVAGPRKSLQNSEKTGRNMRGN